MNAIAISRTELKMIIQKSVQTALTGILINKKNREEFLELVEDFGLGALMDEGKISGLTDKKHFMKDLDSRISGKK